MASLTDPADLLVSEAQLMPLAEVLNLPPDRLLGVSPRALAALSALGVRNVFDLALSGVFNAAAQIEDAADNPANAMNRFGRAVSDLIKPGNAGAIAVADLRNAPINVLADITDPVEISAALGVLTVRDLAVYPPFRAAREILDRVFFPEKLDTFDPESPSDLIPKSGEFPTERVQYTSLVLDRILRPENAPALIDVAGPGFTPINAAVVANSEFGFNTLGLGMLLTMNQSWFMQGVTLGHLLHSMALAAGESTRIAVIDWSRKTSAGQTEVLGESEDLSQDTSRNRTISEVTEAVAREAQSGFSHTESKATTKQAGGAVGFSIGPFGGGASASIAKTSTSADSYATSAGSRQVGASMLQNASDRTHQHAHAARTRRASVVREVSQTEHESVSTRVITNYNHMHAMTVQYYEVLQVYRTQTSLVRCDRVVFVPFKLLDFSDTNLLRRFRGPLIDAALTPAVRDALLNFDTLEFVPEPRAVFPGLGGTLTEVLTRPRVLTAPVLTAPVLARAVNTGGGTEPPAGPDAEPPPPRPPRPPRVDDIADNLWVNAATRLSAFFGTPTVRRGSQSLFVPSDVRVEEGAVQSTSRALKLVFILRNGARIVDLSASVALADVDRIAVLGSEAAADVAATAVLALSRNGIVFPLELPTVTVVKGTAETRLITVRAAGADVNLVQHLADNRLHYSQAVFRNLDSAMIAGLLAPFSITLNGQSFPLVQVAEPIPLRIVGNALAFKINTDPVNDAEWRAFMASRGLRIGEAKVDIVPLSSGGIFAEAVLGRFNCAEKLDITRFFNWQDSPIPIQPTDIAAIQTGTRGTAENVTPGQFSAPLVNITPPAALPDPSGLAGTLAAIQNGNLFRDMSGLAQTIQLATETGKLSAAGAIAAGNQAVEAFKISADLQKAKTLTEKGAAVAKEEELKKKQEAEAAKAKAAAGGKDAPAAGGTGTPTGGTAGGKGGTAAGGGTPSKPAAPVSTGNSALDAIIGNPAALRSFVGQSPDSPDPTREVTAEGVPLQEWDFFGEARRTIKATANGEPTFVGTEDLKEIIAKELFEAQTDDMQTLLLGDRQIRGSAFDKLLLLLSLAPAGSVKTLNTYAYVTNFESLSFDAGIDYIRDANVIDVFTVGKEPKEKPLQDVSLADLATLLAGPDIRVDGFAVKLGDVRKAFPVDGEVRVFNMGNPLQEEFVQALANVFQVRTSGFTRAPVRVTATPLAETENGGIVLSKKVKVDNFLGEPPAPPVDFFVHLLQQDRALTGLFTAFPRR